MLNKAICQLCQERNYPGQRKLRWNRKDEQYWQEGFVICDDSNHANTQKPVPKHCRYSAEQVVSGQNE